MNRISRLALTTVSLGALLAAGGCFSRVKTSSQADVAGAALDRRELAEATASHWSQVSELAARRMMEEYGVPDEVHADHLVWINNGPWRRTIVSNVPAPYAPDGGAEAGVIEQAVSERLSTKQAVDVAAFDDLVAYNPRASEVSSRADREEHNYLRLNLADDVAHERLSPEAARGSYASIVAFEAAGKTSPYLLGLRFSVAP